MVSGLDEGAYYSGRGCVVFKDPTDKWLEALSRALFLLVGLVLFFHGFDLAWLQTMSDWLKFLKSIYTTAQKRWL